MRAHNAETKLYSGRLEQIASLAVLAFALLGLSLVAIQPFTTGQMLYTDDGTLHLYRTIVLDHSLRYDHPLYPRYSSGLAFGYGAPLFNYFSPFAYYLPRTIHLFGISFIQAWLAGMVIYLWIAMAGAYLLGKVWTNRYGGIICATAYLYAPYLLYDAVSRGTITEVAALAILPYVMAALKRLADKPDRFSFFASVFSYALFVPMHNIVTVHGSLLIAPYALLLIWQSSNRPKTFGMLLGAGILGLGMTCFFWLPALAEASYVKINSITEALPSLDVTTHLRSLSDVLVLPQPVDPLQQQAPIPVTVNLFTLLLAVIGLPLIWRRLPAARGIALFCLVTVLLSIFMNLEASAWVWRTVPLLNYTQFAWRILGIGSLSLALGSALTFAALFSAPFRTAQKALYAFLLAMLVCYGISFTYRPYFAPEANTIQDAQAHEFRTNEVALSSYSEYLPNWVEVLPDADRIRQAWQHNQVIVRMEAPQLTILSETWSGIRGRVHYTSPAATTAQINWLYFPGWHIAVDDQQISPDIRDDGTMQVQLPAGTHVMTIAYVGTPLQHFAALVSAAALLIAISSGVMVDTSGQPQDLPMSQQQQQFRLVMIAGLLGIGLFTVKLTVIDHTDNLFHSWHLQSLRNGSPHAVMGGELIIVEAEVLNEPVLAGNTLHVRTVWTLASEAVAKDYAVRYRLTDSMGYELARSDTYEIGGISTRRWLPGYMVEDIVQIEIDSRVVEGTYFVELTVYDTSGGVLSELDEKGFAKRPFTVTAPFKILRPAQSFDAAGDKWAVMESWLDDAQVFPGDQIEVRLAIKAGTVVEALKASVTWRSSSLSRVVSAEVFASKPWNNWLPGEHGLVFVAPYVPSDLAAGNYTLTISIGGIASHDVEYFVGMQSIQPLARSFVTEQVEPVAKWDNGIELRGYHSGQNEFLLCWVTNRELSESYRLSARVLDGDGKLIQQVDMIPENWSRPTTSWAIGEIITSTLELDAVESGAVLTLSWYRASGYPVLAFETAKLSTGAEQFVLSVSEMKSFLVANGNSFNCSGV
jgi:hypothetical protein